MRKPCWLLSLALLCGVASATTRYVAQSAGTFSGGTACNGQTAITLSTWLSLTLSPGDLTWVCGTITVSGNGATGFVFSQSGTSGNPITLKFDTGGVLVSATYWEGAGGGTNGGGIAYNNQSYITVDGNNLAGTIANGLDGSSGAPCYLGTCNVQHSTTLISGWGCTGCTLENLNMINAYVQTAGDSTIGDSSTVTAWEGGGSGWTISGNVVHDGGWLFEEFGGGNDTNFTFSNNNLYNHAHGIAIAPGTGAAFSNFIVSGNQAHNTANWEASGCPYHVDTLMHVFGNATATINNLYVYNNYVYGPTGTCPTGFVFVEGGGSSTPSHLQNSYWWNNVFIVDPSAPTNLSQGWVGIFAGDSGVQQFISNTIIGNNGTDNTSCAAFSGETGFTNMSALTFKDNVIAPCGNPITMGVSGYGVTLTAADYNFYGQYGSNAFTWQSSTKGTFSAWQTACSCDSHSVQNNTSNLNSDGSPQAGSPVIGAGVNLSSIATGNLVSLQSDTTKGNTRTPNVRPSSGAWDIGAYEYAVAPPANGAPAAWFMAGNFLLEGDAR
jgi:hypothetical protein